MTEIHLHCLVGLIPLLMLILTVAVRPLGRASPIRPWTHADWAAVEDAGSADQAPMTKSQ